jgi:hypothetical protein
MYSKFNLDDLPRMNFNQNDDGKKINNSENIYYNKKYDGLEYYETKKKDVRHKKMPNEIKNIKDLSIIPFPTAKTKIGQRKLMEDHVLPTHPSSVIINGKSGSGKSQLIINMLCRGDMYGFDKDNKHYFDEIYFFSPTAGKMDDLCEHLLDYTCLKEENIYNEFDENKLNEILENQKNEINEKGIEKAKKILILLDDIQQDQKFLRSKTILKIFTTNRHYNSSVFLCGQSFTKTPRACRLQANNIMFFAGSKSETDKIVEEYAPPKLSKRDFNDLIDQVLDEPYNFLHINMREPWKTRYRKNLNTLINLE